MSTAFALEVRRPVVVPGREIDWRLFPSGAKRNEGTAIALPAVRRSFSQHPWCAALESDPPLNPRGPSHTQAPRTLKADLHALVGKVSSPMRKLLNRFMKSRSVHMHGQHWPEDELWADFLAGRATNNRIGRKGRPMVEIHLHSHVWHFSE